MVKKIASVLILMVLLTASVFGATGRLTNEYGYSVTYYESDDVPTSSPFYNSMIRRYHVAFEDKTVGTGLKTVILFTCDDEIEQLGVVNDLITPENPMTFIRFLKSKTIYVGEHVLTGFKVVVYTSPLRSGK